jgi:hypothetical protein
MMAQDTGSGMFGCFPAVFVALILGFLLFAGVRQEIAPPTLDSDVATAQAAPDDTTGGRQSLTVVEKVETAVSATVPATITLQISGYHPDGCKFPVQVEQTREGNTVTVKIYRIVPVDVMCTMELNPYNETITLDGTFESGDYTLDVNGTVVQVKV